MRISFWCHILVEFTSRRHENIRRELAHSKEWKYISNDAEIKFITILQYSLTNERRLCLLGTYWAPIHLERMRRALVCSNCFLIVVSSLSSVCADLFILGLFLVLFFQAPENIYARVWAGGRTHEIVRFVSIGFVIRGLHMLNRAEWNIWMARRSVHAMWVHSLQCTQQSSIYFRNFLLYRQLCCRRQWQPFIHSRFNYMIMVGPG